MIVGTATKIIVISDAHLLYQAEWIEDEKTLRDEAREVLDNFDRAAKELAKESPSAIILAGDMFDTKAESGQRVAYREAEKYMLRVRQILSDLAGKTRCKIYALRGNHDSEPVLKSLQSILDGKFVYARNQVVKIGETSLALMDTHYLTGAYEIPLADVPGKTGILFMHESVPLPNISAPSKETFASICENHRLVFNGHLHFYSEKVLGIPNLFLLPAFIPSRDIKNNWMVKYRYENGQIERKTQESPFGYLTIDGSEFQFKRYTPLQVIVRVELIGKNSSDFYQGIRQVYDLLMEREDRQKLRAWITTNADKITVERLFWDRVAAYPEIKTVDILSERGESLRAPIPTLEREFGDVAFTRDELIEKVIQSLDKKQQKIAAELFDRIFSTQILAAKHPDSRQAFRDLLEIMSREEKVSRTFVERAWELSKGG
jgi:predicted phosphodiesterase